jgi:hypothetical protein
MVLGAATQLAGCGSGADAARSQHEAQTAARAGAARLAGNAAAATAADADMVSAVSPVASTTPVSLKFRLSEPPQVGQALRLDLALVQAPGLDIDSLLMSLQPSDGLQIESERSVEFHAPAVGATQRIVVTLRPQAAGLLSVGATVLVNYGGGSLSRNFSIPLIAAQAPPP